MNRRDFLRSVGVASASLALPKTARLFAESAAPGRWRTFEVTTRVEVLTSSGTTRVWLPAALMGETPFQRTLANHFQRRGRHREDGRRQGRRARNHRRGISRRCETGPHADQPDRDKRLRGRPFRAGKAAESWPSGVAAFPAADKAPSHRWHREGDGGRDHQRRSYATSRRPVRSTSGSSTIRFGTRRRAAAASATSASCWSPGIWAASAPISTRSTWASRALQACPRATSTASASQNRNLDIRASARRSANVTKAQHCRAEVHLADYGWVPVDPADVRKVVLEEPPGNRPLDDDMVKKARARLFGSWEMNWMAYNFAHDVALPGSSGAPVGFLMYPQAETRCRPAGLSRSRQFQIRDHLERDHLCGRRRRVAISLRIE